jgi:hypothetical protein
MDENGHIESLYSHCSKANRHDLPDLIYADIVLPEVVTILAPGRKGRYFWKRATDCVIAVNGAVQIPIEKDFWMVSDAAAGQCDWFKWGLAHYHCGPRLFSFAINENLGPPDIGDYTFFYYPFSQDANIWEYMLQPFRQDADFFGGTHSITGIAIDFAIRCGAKEIHLLGVDGEGGYWNDPPGLERNVINDYVFMQLQKEIDYFKKRGIEFIALSPTRLEL